MTTTVEALIAAIGIQWVSTWRRPGARLRRVAVPSLVWWPWPTVAVGAVLWLRHRLARLEKSRAIAARARADVAVLGELTTLGLSAGLGFAQALELAAPRLEPAVRDEVAVLLRAARLNGMSAALASSQGRCAPMFRLCARAVETGAPVAGAIDGFVDQALAEERERALTAARRLPIKLLFPLALLILPGFMILTVGPALLGSIDRLSL
jgi:hypothetical protein